MRYLRMFAVVLFALALIFTGWASFRLYATSNNDYPRITSQSEQISVSVQDGPEALMQGLTATDATDGDLTKQIMVASISHFVEKNTVKVKYVVFDSHNNAGTLTRTVCYTDYTPPRFSLSKAPVYQRGESIDLLDSIRVTDVLDGDISDRVRITYNAASNYTPGVYPVTLEVSNSCGDTQQLSLYVTCLDKENTAQVQLVEYVIYLEQGASFEPENMIASVTDSQHNHLDRSNLTVQGNLDVETPGYYQLVYNYDDGKLSGRSALTVVVTEATQ